MRLVVLFVSVALAAQAHDSPEHKVEELSFAMARSGKSAELLMQRAIEHRALGQLPDAAADFEAAFKLDPKLTVALKELSLVQLAQGQTDVALRTINRAVALGAAADLLMARAEIYGARKDFRAALSDCEAAFQDANANLEWYLYRAQLQRRLGRYQDCLKNLREGFSKTGSAVLHEECIEAMIDAGQSKAALKQIDSELANSRWRSSWLLRRARAYLALGETRSARRDLQSALKELNQRIVPTTPEISLLLDRGLAHALLGDRERALGDLQSARKLSTDATILWRLEDLLRSSPTG